MTLSASSDTASSHSHAGNMTGLLHSMTMHVWLSDACGGWWNPVAFNSTSDDDDGQQFGLSEPVNAAAEVNVRLAGAAVEEVDLRQGLLDLVLRFSSGHLLEIIPTSSGYEAWNVMFGSRQFIAVGGGELGV